MPISVRYLDSRDVESLSEALSRAARRSREMDVAAAFITMTGAQQVIALARELKGRRSAQEVRVIVGLWLDVTEPAALRLLRKQSNVKLRITRATGFHVKHAAFRDRAATVTFTGSANFTAKGLGGVGELVVEVAERGRPTSGEADVFRRLWADTYSDDQTDAVIAKYAKGWKPKLNFGHAAGGKSRSLLKLFGAAAKKKSLPKDDESTLWFRAYGTLSDSTVEKVQKEVGLRNPEMIGLGSKFTFERILNGTRRVWQLDLAVEPRKRTLELHDIIREVEVPTEDGRYFAVLSRARRIIPLSRRNRELLKALKLVRRIDSLEGHERTLRPGGPDSLAGKLLAISRRPKSTR